MRGSQVNEVTALAVMCILLTGSASAQSGFQSGLYQIVSGRYVACCGIGGPIPQSLPNQSQRYIRLEMNTNGYTARMTFLGEDKQTVFSVQPCPPRSRLSFDFPNGFVFPDRLIFHVDPGPDATYWNYTVSNSAGGLHIDGILSTARGTCADWPNEFRHTNVVAVLMPEATIRVSEVEVCWGAVSNRNYQVQYRSSLTTNEWIDLGSPIPGNGSTNCIPDAVKPGEPRRFYRVLTVP